MRFSGSELGAWYAADDIRTAAAEVGHHLRRETLARSVATMTRTAGPIPQRCLGIISTSGPAEYAFGCLRERALCHSACKFWKPIDTLKRRVSVRLEANAV